MKDISFSVEDLPQKTSFSNDGSRSSQEPQATEEPETLLQPRDEPVASTTDENVSVTDVVKSSSASGKRAISSHSGFPLNLPDIHCVIRSQHGVPFAIKHSEGTNPEALEVGGNKLNNEIRRSAMAQGRLCKRQDLNDINDCLRFLAEEIAQTTPVWHRVADLGDGIIINVGSDNNVQIKVTAAGVEIIKGDSGAIFFCPSVMSALPIPAEKGNVQLLYKYLNLSDSDQILLVAWMTYTLATPKQSSRGFKHLVVDGGEGSGKTFLCEHIILPFTDPSAVGVQSFPGKVTDLAIASQNAHVLCYDNMRSINASMSDALAQASKGAKRVKRALYTDSNMSVIQLHAAIVFNGIHRFVQQPDLAQRCLIIHTQKIPEGDRQQERKLLRELEQDKPVIFRGLLDLIARIFEYLPDVTVTHPERMLDFCYWLAAMEKVDAVPEGSYQKIYSDSLRQTQLDTLLEHSLAAATFEFASDLYEPWSGTPSDLLCNLERMPSAGCRYSRDWPQNSIALSKRLNSLRASLATQGIWIEFSRGKHRKITITNVELPKNEPVSEPVFGDDDIAF